MWSRAPLFLAGLALLAASVPSKAAAAPAESARRIDPTADRVLRRMCDYLRAQRQFSFVVSEQFDVVRESGQKIQYGNYRQVTVRRPNKIYSDIRGDTLNRRVWYDGKTLTMLDKERNLYARVAVRPTIDATLDHLSQQYGVQLPLADLLFSDPYKVLTEKVSSGAYFGLHTVEQRKAHHLAFTQENLDWQVWVAAGARPLPLKVVIAYKQQTGQPGYQATLRDWRLGDSVSDATFRSRLPKNAARIEFIPVGGQPRDVRAVPK
jgi:hypothetical protein